MRAINSVVKYIFDRFFGFIGVVLFLPVIIVISIMILFVDGLPIFFKQRRVGRYGRVFNLIKFRTMIINDGKYTVTSKDDARITKLGMFLRKYKLDEIPEIALVYLGKMSFVGPRPDVPGYADKLYGEDREILKLRPGITGPATLKYRHEEELLSIIKNPKKYNDEVIFPDKIRINREYHEHNNLLLDLKIILRTAFFRK